MKNDFLRIIFLFIIIGIIYYSFGLNYAMLVFVLTFQLVGIIPVIKDYLIYSKVKNGPFTTGHIIYRGDTSEDDFLQPVEISFIPPSDYKEVIILDKVPVKIGDTVRVWINLTIPSKSICIEKYDSTWGIKSVISAIILLAFFIVDYYIIFYGYDGKGIIH